MLYHIVNVAMKLYNIIILFHVYMLNLYQVNRQPQIQVILYNLNSLIRCSVLFAIIITIIYGRPNQVCVYNTHIFFGEFCGQSVLSDNE